MNKNLLYAVLPFFVVSLLISGCGGIPVSAHPTDKFVDTKEADSLIGQPIHTINHRFGKPSFELNGSDSNYYIYISVGELDLMWDVFIPFVLLPADIYGDVDWVPVFCAVFESDKSGYIKGFNSDWSTYYFPSWSVHKELNISDDARLGICMHQLWTDKDIEQITAESKKYLKARAKEGDKEAAMHLASWFGDMDSLKDMIEYGSREDMLLESVASYEIKERAERGDVSAQWELYKQSKSLGKHDFKWLCKAAEQGYYRAQWELGYLHLNGLYGVRKDLVLSVMWYSLVEAGGYDVKGVDDIRRQLTPEQLAVSERLYESWKPGRCAREILGAESIYTQ